MAVFFNEKHRPWVADRLRASRLRMSTVNYAEVLILVQDRQPQLYPEIREAILSSRSRLVPPTPTGRGRRVGSHQLSTESWGLSCLALAKADDCPILTLDRDFLKTDTEVVLPQTALVRPGRRATPAVTTDPVRASTLLRAFCTRRRGFLRVFR
jgi:PIN domain nuclease of toxin-antitoxin system